MVEILSPQHQIKPASYGRQHHFASERMAGSVPVWGNEVSIQKNASVQSGLETNKLAYNSDQQDRANSKAPSFSFGEFIDIINPLQHIPVVNKIYRHFTGDEISSVAQIIGGGIYGGPIGAATSIAAAAIDEHGGGTEAMFAQASSSYKRQDISLDIEDKKMPAQGQRWHFND